MQKKLSLQFTGRVWGTPMLLWSRIGTRMQLVSEWPANASFTISGSWLLTPRRQCLRATSAPWAQHHCQAHSIALWPHEAWLQDTGLNFVRHRPLSPPLLSATVTPPYLACHKTYQVIMMVWSCHALLFLILYSLFLLFHTFARRGSFCISLPHS